MPSATPSGPPRAAPWKETPADPAVQPSRTGPLLGDYPSHLQLGLCLVSGADQSPGRDSDPGPKRGAPRSPHSPAHREGGRVSGGPSRAWVLPAAPGIRYLSKVRGHTQRVPSVHSEHGTSTGKQPPPTSAGVLLASLADSVKRGKAARQVRTTRSLRGTTSSGTTRPGQDRGSGQPGHPGMPSTAADWGTAS